MKTIPILTICSCAILFFGCQRKRKKIVITALPALESILNALTENSTIEVVYPVPDDISLAEHDQYWEKNSHALDSLAKIVTAVVDIRSVTPEEILYLHIRKRNISVIEIDCATPLDEHISSVPLIKNDNEINTYIWLSISNIMKMAEIAAKDLSRLFPVDSIIILDNLQKVKKRYFSLKSDFESQFSVLERFEAVTMVHAFDYLLNDINLFVTHCFASDENEWTGEERRTFKEGVNSGEIHTLIHRWKPVGDIGTLCDKKGVSTAVLVTGDPKLNNFDNGLYGLLEKNLSILLKTLSKK